MVASWQISFLFMPAVVSVVAFDSPAVMFLTRRIDDYIEVLESEKPDGRPEELALARTIEAKLNPFDESRHGPNRLAQVPD